MKRKIFYIVSLLLISSFIFTVYSSYDLNKKESVFEEEIISTKEIKEDTIDMYSKYREYNETKDEKIKSDILYSYTKYNKNGRQVVNLDTIKQSFIVWRINSQEEDLKYSYN